MCNDPVNLRSIILYLSYIDTVVKVLLVELLLSSNFIVFINTHYPNIKLPLTNTKHKL